VVVGGVGSDGFVYQNGALTLLSVPGAYATGAAGIDDLGQVVGAFFDNTGSHGFLYQNGVYCIMSLAGSTANGINDYGQIVGTYFTPNDMDILRFGLGACGRNIYGSETKDWLRRREARGLSRNFPPCWPEDIDEWETGCELLPFTPATLDSARLSRVAGVLAGCGRYAALAMGRRFTFARPNVSSRRIIGQAGSISRPRSEKRAEVGYWW
jgi:probable HAF family extracellular repeat protein